MDLLLDAPRPRGLELKIVTDATIEAPRPRGLELVAAIEADLGGSDQLSTIERTLVAAYCGACVLLEHLNTQLALGQEINFAQHAQAVTAMTRVASRLGLQRRAKPVASLQDYLREKYGPIRAAEAAAERDEEADCDRDN